MLGRKLFCVVGNFIITDLQPVGSMSKTIFDVKRPYQRTTEKEGSLGKTQEGI